MTFEFLNEHTYLNTASVGLIPNESFNEKINYLNKQQRIGGKIMFDVFETILPQAKEAVSGLINCEPNELAFTANFSTAINYLIPSLKKHNRVLLYEDDYPSLNKPFELNGFEVNYISKNNEHTIKIKEIEHLIIDKNIELLAISQTQFKSGYTIQLKELGVICKKHNCILLVDGTQALGMAEVNVKQSNVDVYISSGYKWLMGGFGVAFTYVNPSFFARITPRIAGYGSLNFEGSTPKYNPSMQSFEPGHINYAPLIALTKSIKLLQEYSLEKARIATTELINYLLNELKKNGLPVIGDFQKQHRLGIVSVTANEKMFNKLNSKNIITTYRSESIRISPYFYNTKNDVDLLIKTISPE